MFSDKDIQTRMHANEDAMIMTGLMANAGIKDSQGGTSMRAIFSRFGAENRNVKFALDALGVDFTDEHGEVRRIRDIMGDLRQKFNEGDDVEGFMKFAEEMSGQKINADARSKLDSFLKNVQKHGGKMTGVDRLKMASMLSGQEAMSGFLAATMLGDLTLLGSAWDAFQQDLFTGMAGDGLRNFVQTLTDVVSKAQEFFSDGIQIGDFGKIIFDVVDRLRAKFMEARRRWQFAGERRVDGGVRENRGKIHGLIDGFRNLRAPSTSTATATSRGVAAGQSVGTMTVNAGVVNVKQRWLPVPANVWRVSAATVLSVRAQAITSLHRVTTAAQAAA